MTASLLTRLSESGTRTRVGRPTTSLNVILVHDWLTGMRGGEKVLELLCRRFPTAPLWTLLHLPGKISHMIAERPIHTSLLQYLPFSSTHYRHYLPLFPLLAELHKVRHADLVISSSHAVAKSMVLRRGSKQPYHICYIHTPMRYVWDMFDDYFGVERVGYFASSFLFKPIAWLLQTYDRATVDRVDLFLANSSYVANSVRRIYGRHAEVVAPPVDTDRFLTLKREPEEWYVIVSALVPYKRVDHAIRACHGLGRKLKIVGKGPELEALKKLARGLGADVEFVGFVSDVELGHYYRHARALLFPGVEDFGIVPVEAIACGCPVIAIGAGGILDSMTPATAVLYDQPTAEGLTTAIIRFEAREEDFPEDQLRSRARLFSEANFLTNIDIAIQQAMDEIFRQSHASMVPLADSPY
jgi:glycosyltransferase involved in cell wall biosynthesis